ncbi:hypothetical protein HC891_25735 [Candidatus Gracilibacteria bacterium]|nr:hypothetical protein [Candidatus Gracilibacteria bacterium]
MRVATPSPFRRNHTRACWVPPPADLPLHLPFDLLRQWLEELEAEYQRHPSRHLLRVIKRMRAFAEEMSAGSEAFTAHRVRRMQRCFLRTC